MQLCEIVGLTGLRLIIWKNEKRVKIVNSQSRLFLLKSEYKKKTKEKYK